MDEIEYAIIDEHGAIAGSNDKEQVKALYDLIKHLYVDSRFCQRTVSTGEWEDVQ